MKIETRNKPNVREVTLFKSESLEAPIIIPLTSVKKIAATARRDKTRRHQPMLEVAAHGRRAHQETLAA